MKKILLILFVQILCFDSLFSQNVNECVCDSTSMQTFESKLKGYVFRSSEHVSGSQYYYDWGLGDVQFINGEIVHNQELRYNGYFNELMWMTPKLFKTIVLNKSEILDVHFKYPDRLLRKMKISGYPDSVDVFMEVLCEGKLSLYVYRKIVEANSTLVENDGSSYSIPTLKNDPIFFLKTPESEKLLPFNRITKRSFIRLFTINRIKVKHIVRESQMSIDGENDLIRMVQYLNEKL